MANYRENQPINYTPYVSQVPMDALVKVGMQREGDYNLAVQKIQQEVNDIGSIDLARSQGKAYLNQKMTDLVGKINSAAGTDFSNPAVFNQLTTMAATVGNDQNILNEAIGTQEIRQKQQQIKDLKEKHPELYSSNNEEYSMMDINKWLNDGSPVGTRLNDRRAFTPFYDANKESQDLVKDFLSRPDEFTQEKLDPNTGMTVKTTFKGKTPDQIKQYLNANLSDKAKNQFVIDGTVNGSRLSDAVFLQEYQRDKENQIRSLQQDGNILSQAYHNSALSPEEKNNISLRVNDINKQIDNLNLDKGNIDYMKNALSQKADYYGQIYAKQKIDNIGSTSAFSQNSMSYGSNEAIVAQLNRIASRENMIYTQAQENARASLTNQLGWARLNHEDVWKEREFGLKEVELGIKYGNGLSTPFNPQAPSGTYDRSLLPKQDNTTQTTGVDAYNTYMSETLGKMNDYNNSKTQLYNKLSSIKSYQDDLAKSVGKTWDKMSEADKHNAFNNYITAKNDDYNKGQNLPKELNEFYYNATETLRNLNIRRTFGENANKEVLNNMTKEGYRNITINGQTYTPRDILEYVTTGNGKLKEVKSIIDNPSAFEQAGNPLMRREYSNKYAPIIDAINNFKNSPTLKEYFNKFNYSSGQEAHSAVRSFDLKNKAQEADFTKWTGTLMGLLQQKDPSEAASVDPSKISPISYIDYSTGDITFRAVYKGKNNTEIIKEYKVNDPSLKFNNQRDLDLQSEIFMNGGHTGNILITGPKPFNVTIKSDSDDKNSKYTRNLNNTKAKYTVYDQNNNQIRDPFNGFDSPSAAESWIQGMGSAITSQKAAEWYNSVKDNPQFKSMTPQQQAQALKKSLEEFDPANHMQFISTDIYSNILEGLKNSQNKK